MRPKLPTNIRGEKNMKTSKLCCPLFLLFFFSPLLKGQEFQVKVLNSESDLPENFCTLAKKGDYFITDGKYLILIGGTERTLQTSLNYPAADAKGSVIGFAPAGKKLVSEMIIGSPYLRIKGERKYIKYDSVKLIKNQSAQGGLVVRAAAFYKEGKYGKAEITTDYRIHSKSGQIGLTSKIENTGKIPIKNLTYSLYFRAMHEYSFSPYHSGMHPDLHFRIYPKKGHSLGWLDQNRPQENRESMPGTLEPGESFEVHFSLLVATEGYELLQKIYKILNTKPEKTKIHLENRKTDLVEVIVRDPLSQTIFYRSFLKNPVDLDVPLPRGFYSVTANFFPAVVERLFLVESDRENTCILQDPPQGNLKIKIQNRKAEYVPGKVTFIGLDPTKTPYFEPENPIETGKRWETFKNSRYPEKDGLEVRLPVGAYLVYASRGPEYSVDTKIVEIYQDMKEWLTFCIDKVIQEEQLISVDPHMHTVYSDGRMDIAERIKSAVAEGLDVAVSTDHNYINDYQPALIKLGLDTYLATIIGNEVTRGGVIHYNTYPLLYRGNGENNGAINPYREEASLLFHASREKDPGALLQVNHPRSGSIGYFNNYELDPENASSAKENFDLSFDILEVLNGPYPYDSNEQSVNDWLNLLNRGYYFPIVGSSDAHTIDRGETGYSRTYVFYKGAKGKNLDVSSLIHAMKEGHSFASNGPVVDFKINEKYIPGDSLTVKDRKVEIWLKVKSAPWISVDEVRLIVNGRRKIIFPVQNPTDSVLKFSEKISLPLEEDSYIVAEVLGKKSLFPVHQSRARYGLQENATLPYALTNPIFVDVDGNGKFDSPLPHDIHTIGIAKTENNKEE
jgi:predicted metal-dependent phosphoesterase TrpH